MSLEFYIHSWSLVFTSPSTSFVTSRSCRQPTMKPHLFYLFRFLAFTSAAITSPLFLNDSEIVNTAAHVGTIDPRFTIEAYFNGPKLPLVSCLVSTVDFLVVLALQDFSGSMGEAAWKIDDYPEVGIVVAPGTEGGRIEVRFVMWGLRLGAAYMIRLIRFQAVTFTLSCRYLLPLFFPNPDRIGKLRDIFWK